MGWKFTSEQKTEKNMEEDWNLFFSPFSRNKKSSSSDTPPASVDLRPILRLDSDHDDFVSPPEFKDLALRKEVICYIAMEAMAHLVRWFT
jgi:hypothetical protein